jgi:hypothetical protein
VYGDEDDETSGGHLHGTGRPDKTEFPSGWDEDKIVAEVQSVADRPDSVSENIDGTWLAKGNRDGVTIAVALRSNGHIATGYPTEGPGVRTNPRRREG